MFTANPHVLATGRDAWRCGNLRDNGGVAYVKPIPLIRAAGPLAFVGLLSDAGAPVERLWGEAKLPSAARRDPDRLVPLQFMVRFTEQAAATLAMPDLGLRVAAREDLECVGRFGVAIRRAPTLQRALETTRDLVRLHDSGERYWFVPEGDSVRFCRRVRGQGDAFRQGDLFTIGLMIKIVRLAAGAGWRPSRIELQSTGPTHVPNDDLLGDAAVSTGQPLTSVTFPRRLLARPIPPPASPESRPAAGTDGWVASGPPEEFVASVRAVIAAGLDDRPMDVVTVARAAGTSVRSLQRSLAAAGTSYTTLLDAARCATAIRLLRDPDVKLVQLALALGYSDQAHFTRAFRRWTSVSPAEYRDASLRQRLESDLSA